MGLFSRRRSAGSAHGSSRREQNAAKAATIKHFQEFVATRQGVEAYFEPETPREQSALLLVARDGEWTRRRIPDPTSGAQLAQELGIPFYEVVKTGYPDAMRQWNRRQGRR
ncbi:MAG: oxidoreductase [Actinomycetaceae bacterium]|nr:oxidoreductase [Actinomycetaceae bacterium]